MISRMRCFKSTNSMRWFKSTNSMRWFSSNSSSKSSLLLQVRDSTGVLRRLLKLFDEFDLNLTRIESRPSKNQLQNYDFFIDFESCGKSEEQLIKRLEQHCLAVIPLSHKKVPWFPRKRSDLDASVATTLDAGDQLQSDHPGFKDQTYRARRDLLADVALKHRIGNPIPHIQYTEEEVKVWGAVYDRMVDLWAKYACDEFNYILPLLESNCGYANDNIPQQQDISNFLKECTGFTLRPVCGLLSSRDFLNGLAFRVFFSTQYIRHHSMPLYTPEPDICHELMGHAPMFADPDFADFSHEIGLASLGASDEEIDRLATCYWYSVEFGMCKASDGSGDLKAYGAGLLSSFGELEYACASNSERDPDAPKPEYRPWDPFQAWKQSYPITTYQPIYYVADSLLDAKLKMREFCEDLKRPFHARYDPYGQQIIVDRNVEVQDKEKNI